MREVTLLFANIYVIVLYRICEGFGEMAHEFSEEGRKARFEQWEKLGLDRVKSDLQSDPYRRVGSGDVQNLAWEWVRIKEAEMGLKETDREAALRGLYSSSLDEVLSGRTALDTALARSSSVATSGGRIMGALKEPERITLVEGLKLLESHLPAEEPLAAGLH